MRIQASAVLCVLILISCTPIPQASTIRATIPATELATRPSLYQRGIVYLEISHNLEPEMAVGQTVTVKLVFHPLILDPNNSKALIPWVNHDIAEMNVCFSLGELTSSDCSPNWKPFKDQLDVTFPVDWVGDHYLALMVEFRNKDGQLINATDFDGNVILTPQAIRINVTDPAWLQYWAGIYNWPIKGTYDSRTPIAALPAQVRGAVAASETATVGAMAAQAATASATIVFPATHVTGSVRIPGGINSGGGETGTQAGTSISLDVAFNAKSPFAEVTEMRLSTGGSPESAPWERYQANKTFIVDVPYANWFGFGIAVQYRDALGNLSPIYSDSISIEGTTP